MGEEEKSLQYWRDCDPYKSSTIIISGFAIILTNDLLNLNPKRIIIQAEIQITNKRSKPKVCSLSSCSILQITAIHCDKNKLHILSKMLTLHGISR